MERALRERLVGAVVIVVLGVIFIPLLLDGPEESGRAVEPGLALPSGSPGVRTVTLPVGRSADEPAPVPSPSAGAPVAPRPDAGTVRRPAGTEGAGASPPPATVTAQPKPAPTGVTSPKSDAPARVSASPPPAVTASGGEWAVQVGSFSQADNAGRLKDKLVGDGFAAYVSKVVTDAGTMHRVRVGPVPAREDADRMLARLVRSGQKGRVVRVED